jgi:hypothetical protein
VRPSRAACAALPSDTPSSATTGTFHPVHVEANATTIQHLALPIFELNHSRFFAATCRTPDSTSSILDCAIERSVSVSIERKVVVDLLDAGHGTSDRRRPSAIGPRVHAALEIHDVAHGLHVDVEAPER